MKKERLTLPVCGKMKKSAPAVSGGRRLRARCAALALLCLALTLALTSCTIYFSTDMNPGRSRTVQTLRSYDDGVRLDASFKGGNILYGTFMEQYDGGFANTAEYTYAVRSAGGEDITIDYTAYAPTRPDMTDPRLTDKDGNPIPITFPTVMRVYTNGFPDQTGSTTYVDAEVGGSGSKTSGTVTIPIPRGTNDGCILVVVSCFSYFDLDESYVNLTRETNECTVRIRVNPPVDESLASCTEAATNGGDAYVTIPAVIVTTVASAAAAAVALGAEGGASAAAAGSGTNGEDGGNGEENEEETEDGGYRMAVSKDFGNSVKRGAPLAAVYARIEQITGGKPQDKPDLTACISVECSGGLRLSSYALEDRGMAAYVSADEKCEEAEGTVSFRFNGAGGAFTYNVVFHIVGDPDVRYVDGTDYISNYSIPAVLGDRGTYRATFYFNDVTDEPKSITFFDNPDLEISYAPADRERTYTAALINRTAKPEKTLFAKPRYSRVSFRAEFPNGDAVESAFYVTFYPAGLSLSCDTAGADGMEISTERNPNAGGLDPEIRPTGFDLVYAVSKTEGGETKAELLTGSRLNVKVGTLIGKEGCAPDFEKKFQFKIDGYRSNEGHYAFCPEKPLAQKSKAEPFRACLPVHAAPEGYGEEDVEIPLLLTGELPSPGPDTWEVEYKKLQDTVKKFGLSSNGRAREMLHASKYFTANELCMIRRAVIVESNLYYSQELAEWQELDAELGRTLVILNTVKFFGDQAFSYLVQTYGGGPMVEAFASPMKDMFCEWAGEYMAAKCNGTEFTYGADGFYSAYLSGCENAITNMITGETPPTPQKLKWLVAAFLIINYTRHYALDEDTKGDVFKSLLASFGDISVGFIKNKLEGVFDGLLEKNVFSGKKLGDIIGKLGPKKIADVNGNWSALDAEWSSTEIVKKYFVETIGNCVQAVYDKTAEDAAGLQTAAQKGAGTLAIEMGKYCIVINNPLMLAAYLGSKCFDVLFECIKELIPSAPKPIYDTTCHNYYLGTELPESLNDAEADMKHMPKDWKGD